MKIKRSSEEIGSKYDELVDKMWLGRHLFLVEKGLVTKEKHSEVFEIEQVIRNKYGWQDYKGESDYKCGEVNGARRLLEWLSGEDWDCSLDT